MLHFDPATSVQICLEGSCLWFVFFIPVYVCVTFCQCPVVSFSARRFYRDYLEECQESAFLAAFSEAILCKALQHKKLYCFCCLLGPSPFQGGLSTVMFTSLFIVLFCCIKKITFTMKAGGGGVFSFCIYSKVSLLCFLLRHT